MMPLPAILDSQILPPDHALYEQNRSTYVRAGAPRVILQPRGRAELSAALRYAAQCRAQEGLPFSVRSGGHGLFGASTNEGGILLDLSAFREITLTPSGQVCLGAGAVWEEVNHALAPHGRLLGAGVFGGIGVGGLTMHGGIGPLVRLQGLTIDRLVQAEVALASGEIVTASPKAHPELFWALRGGAGQVGVALA